MGKQVIHQIIGKIFSKYDPNSFLGQKNVHLLHAFLSLEENKITKLNERKELEVDAYCHAIQTGFVSRAISSQQRQKQKVPSR